MELKVSLLGEGEWKSFSSSFVFNYLINNITVREKLVRKFIYHEVVKAVPIN